MIWYSRRSAWGALLLLASAGGNARAQSWREGQVFATAVASDPAIYAAGVGAFWRDGQRSRIGVAVATGRNADQRAAARGELAWHFLLDPARRRGAAVYGGVGLAVTAVENARLRPWFLLTLGMEWNPAGARGVFIETGAGGGARVNLGLRIRKQNAPGR